jgi:hypothetical protein
MILDAISDVVRLRARSKTHGEARRATEARRLLNEALTAKLMYVLRGHDHHCPPRDAPTRRSGTPISYERLLQLTARHRARMAGALIVHCNIRWRTAESLL